MLYILLGLDLLLLITAMFCIARGDNEEGANGAFLFFTGLAAFHIYGIAYLATM